MPAPLYHRFVPSKPTIRKPASPSPQLASLLTPTQSKNEKKSKKRREHEPIQEINKLEADQSTAGYDARDVTGKSKRPEKKPKKRKRESVADSVIEEDESTPKKHKSIMSKFDKVSKQAQEHAQSLRDRGEESDDAPAEEVQVLRGKAYRKRPSTWY
jgi:ATP-dependent RNA helicase DDX51/DBP6